MQLEVIADSRLVEITGGGMFDSPLAILAIPLILQGYSQPSTAAPLPVPAQPQRLQAQPRKLQSSWP